MSTSSQLVCIKRPEPGLPAVFEDMYLNERLVDVTLSCCDGQLQAHRLVLAASSPYFDSLFDKLANPFHYPVIVIKDMRIADLRLIVDFMYRGQLTLSQDRLLNLMKKAENLQINGLSIQAQHLSITDQQHQQQQQQQQLNNQLQVLSHSLAANRSSMVQTPTSNQQVSPVGSQQSRNRVHPCNICWKTFREKANLKRHLQVHSLDRVIYECPDCNKTFSWKDNYIRHQKTAHHINNVRPQA